MSSTPSTYGPERAAPEPAQDKDEPAILPSPSLENSEVSHAAVATQENNENLTSGLPFSKARCIGLVATLTGASFLNSMSGQAVVIILPTIGRELSIPESRLQWVLSAYSLAFGCFLLFWGRVADIYGKRKIFVAGSAWFAATTLVNPFLPNEIAFDLFRGLQGLGAAASVPTAIGILGTTFPPSKAKNYAFSCYAAGAPLGAVLGNILGGIIAEYVSWKWVFVAISLAAFAITAAGVFVIPSSERAGSDGGAQKPSVDWLGAVLITVGLLALLLALTEGNVVGWRTPWISVVIVVSVMLVALFAFWQHHLEKTDKKAPILKVSNFRNPQFSAAMGTMALFFSSFNGFLVYATYFYQDYQGLSPLNTTLRFLPTGISGSITAAIVSQLLARVPTYLLLAFGNAFVSLSALLFAAPIPPDTTYWAWSFPAMMISVFGADTTWPCLVLFTSHSLPPQDQALGGALVNAMGQVGRAIGLAVATAIQTTVMSSERGVSVEEAGSVEVGDRASLLGLRAAEWWNFGLGISALAVVLVAFRGTGIVGKAGVAKPSESEGAELPAEGRKQEQAAAS
ncbi:major facilitator superfamily-domain-containing protein [Thermothelomyces heterothallicus CBS 202.75]|uniref:major facilitator superfamily-domain-containing protein n=1 Tax=Thermothelomyces heterothallicus CBS 202.75 TaxID=1149848 RepID=UPI0037430074